MKMTRSALAVVTTSLLMFGVLVPGASAQTAGGADLALTVEGPAQTPLVGEIFQISLKVNNQGPAVAEETFLSDYLSAELRLVSAVSSDATDSCSTDGGGGSGGGTAPPGEPAPAKPVASPRYYGASLGCSLGAMQPGESVTVTLKLERIGARETYNSASVSSTTEDPLYDNNYSDLSLAADRSKPADLGVTITGPKAPDVGATFDYVVTVTNNGPSQADGVVLTDSLSGVRFVSYTSSATASSCTNTGYEGEGYGELYCDLGSLASGASVTITVTAERVSAWEIYNSAYVSTANLDENYENDYAFHSAPADPSVTSDLSLKMQGPANAPLVGDTFDMVMSISNSGPSTAGDVWVSDYLPDGLDFVSVSPADKCSYNDSQRYPYAEGPTAAPEGKAGDSYYPIYANGLYCSLGSLASGASETVTLTVTRTRAQELWNSSWVSSSNYDPYYENNYSDVVLAPDKSNPADLSVTMQAPKNPANGSDFDLSIDVTNNGPSQADGVELSTSVPFGLELRSVAPADACTYTNGGGPEPLAAEREGSRIYYGYQEIHCDFGSIPAGGTKTVTVSVTRTTEYEIWASAWASTVNYDGNYENDYASALIEGEPYPGACPAGGGSVEGSSGGDEIVVGDCWIDGKAGADAIEAAPSSGSKDMKIEGGRGADTIRVLLNIESAESRTIQVNAGTGRDTIELVVTGGVGNARVILNGGEGDDQVILRLSSGSERLRVLARGNAGDDVITSPSEDGTSTGFPGTTLRGGGGKDILEAGIGADRLLGGLSADRLFGGLGDDELQGGRGRDLCRGGPGRDSQTC